MDTKEIQNVTLESIIGDSEACNVIRNYVKLNNSSICCLGRIGTGKSFTLNAVVKETGYFESKEFLLKSVLVDLGYYKDCALHDEVSTDDELRDAAIGRIKYYTTHGDSIIDYYNRLKSLSKDIVTTLVIVNAIEEPRKRYIKGIYELSTTGVKVLWANEQVELAV